MPSAPPRACLAIGLDLDQVRTGLAAFRNEASQNRGRLNVYDVDGVTVILDFAHNLAGLNAPAAVGPGMVEAGRTAGSRSWARPVTARDDAFIEIGRLAGAEADHVIAKDTKKYLRGRQPGETIDLLEAWSRLHPRRPLRNGRPMSRPRSNRRIAWAAPAT